MAKIFSRAISRASSSRSLRRLRLTTITKRPMFFTGHIDLATTYFAACRSDTSPSRCCAIRSSASSRTIGSIRHSLPSPLAAEIAEGRSDEWSNTFNRFRATIPLQWEYVRAACGEGPGIMGHARVGGVAQSGGQGFVIRATGRIRRVRRAARRVARAARRILRAVEQDAVECGEGEPTSRPRN